MTTSEHDDKSLIREVFQSFQALRNLDQRRTKILYGTHGELLTAALANAGFAVPVPSPSGAGLRYSQDARTGLDGNIIMSAAVRNQRWAGRGDTLELGAYYLLLALDKGKRVTDAIKDSIIKAPFAAVWMVLDPFDPPADPDAVEDYIDGKLFCHLEVDPGRGTAFAEDAGRVTLGVRRVEKTIYQVARDFGEGDDPNAVRVWQEQFAGFRASYGVDEWSEYHAPNGKKLVIWQKDDGNEICYFCESPKGDYLPLHKRKDHAPIPNPIGKPLLNLACGYFNSDAELPENRYVPFAAPWIDQMWSCDLERSMIKSYDLSFNHRVLEMDPATLLQAVEGKSDKEAGAFIDSVMVRENAGILKVIGKFQQGGMALSELLKTSLEMDDADLKALLPRQPLDQQTLRNASATALAVETQNTSQQYGSPRAALTRVIHDVVEDGLALYRRSEDSYFLNKPGGKTFIALRGSASGEEMPRGKSVKSGTAVYLDEERLGPDADWYDLKVEYVDMSAQAVAARKMQADDDYARGAIDEEQWLEARDVTNVTEQVKRLEAERRWKAMVPILDGVAATSQLLLVSAMTGIPAQEIMAAMSGPQQMGGEPAPPAGSNGKSAGSGSYNVGPPAVNETPVGVAS